MNGARLGRARLQRDRLTLTLYTPFITWGWFLYGFSPAVPLIADEQGISRGLAGLHGTAMAAGTIAAGLISSTLAIRHGRKAQSLVGCVALVGGVALLLAGATLATTLPACFVVAVGGNLTVSAAQPALAVHHAAAGPAAITEANAMGATVGLLAPLALGASVGLGWGWRPAVAFVIVLAATVAALLVQLRNAGALGPGAVTRSPTVPVAGGTSSASRRRTDRAFSRTFWFFWSAMLCGVAIEFSTTFWASDLLVARTGASASVATASVSALIAGMSISRYIVGPLSMRKAPEKILILAFGVAGAGWALVWLATSPVVAVAGLVLAGLGYGAHYPLSASLTLRASDGRPDQAQATASIGTGIAVGLAPFLLGTLADSFGAHSAFLLVPVLIVVGCGAVALGLRSVRRTSSLPQV